MPPIRPLVGETRMDYSIQNAGEPHRLRHLQEEKGFGESKISSIFITNDTSFHPTLELSLNY